MANNHISNQRFIFIRECLRITIEADRGDFLRSHARFQWKYFHDSSQQQFLGFYTIFFRTHEFYDVNFLLRDFLIDSQLDSNIAYGSRVGG